MKMLKNIIIATALLGSATGVAAADLGYDYPPPRRYVEDRPPPPPRVVDRYYEEEPVVVYRRRPSFDRYDYVDDYAWRRPRPYWRHTYWGPRDWGHRHGHPRW